MDEKRLYVMQGVPGSGKSTVAYMLKSYLSLVPLVDGDPHWDERCEVSIRSTDDYRYGDCGHYIHEDAKNHELHMRTQREVADDMRAGVPYVIVDNTNIAQWQANPYFALAKMYGYEIEVIRVDPGLKASLKRNKTRPIERQVPDFVIERMYEQMEKLVP